MAATSVGPPEPGLLDPSTYGKLLLPCIQITPHFINAFGPFPSGNTKVIPSRNRDLYLRGKIHNGHSGI